MWIQAVFLIGHISDDKILNVCSKDVMNINELIYKTDSQTQKTACGHQKKKETGIKPDR